MYQNRHDWVGKVIHRELCKKSKFDYTTKWYMHNAESVVEFETHKFLWDLETRPSDNQRKKKWSYWIEDLTFPADHKVKIKERRKEKRYKYLGQRTCKKYGIWS